MCPLIWVLRSIRSTTSSPFNCLIRSFVLVMCKTSPVTIWRPFSDLIPHFVGLGCLPGISAQGSYFLYSSACVPPERLRHSMKPDEMIPRLLREALTMGGLISSSKYFTQGNNLHPVTTLPDDDSQSDISSEIFIF